jgi:hypothetical protein
MTVIPLGPVTTKNILRVVDLPENMVSYIQRLHYEMEGYKAINKAILTGTGEFKYNRDIYSYHMQKFQEAHSEFKIGMNTLQEMYAADLVSEKEIQISVDFLGCTVTFFTYNTEV